MSKALAKYSFIPGKGWLGVIYRQKKGVVTVLDVGVEHTREAVEAWCDLALKNRPWEPGGSPAPDAHDRNVTKH